MERLFGWMKKVSKSYLLTPFRKHQIRPSGYQQGCVGSKSPIEIWKPSIPPGRWKRTWSPMQPLQRIVDGWILQLQRMNHGSGEEEWVSL